MPNKPTDIPEGLKSISHSFFGISAAIDKNEKLWQWTSATASLGLENPLDLDTVPTATRALRHRKIKQIYTG